jgi:hypothetical protein
VSLRRILLLLTVALIVLIVSRHNFGLESSGRYLSVDLGRKVVSLKLWLRRGSW